MAILNAIDLDDAMPAAEAAANLGISLQRVRALVAAGDLPAQKVAGRWFIARDAVERRLRNPKMSGRPFSSSNAWALINLADGEPPDWIDAFSLSRLRRQLRGSAPEDLRQSLSRRGRRLELYAHPSDISRIAAEPDVIRSGVSAAREHSLDIIAPGILEAYVPARRLPKLMRAYRLKPSSEPNLILRVVDGNWPFRPGQRVVPKFAAILDLLDDDDERGQRAGRAALKSYASPR